MAVLSNDFGVVGGDTTAENLAAVEQLIGIACRLFLKECYLDESQGVDWLGKILIKSPNSTTVNAELTAAIQSVGGGSIVTRVVSAGLVLGPNRSATISYSVITIYSTDALNGEVTQP
jgi:hypothetical protein